MQLTKKQLKEILRKDYLISNYIDIVISDNKYFYIIYPYYMVRVVRFEPSGWSFSFYGESNYSYCKHFVKLCDYLDENQYTLANKESK